jgi:tetratricopeptide (TPR) repeat protein
MPPESNTWLDELQKGLALARKGGFDAALQCFERARAMAPDRPETACALGREHMRRGDTQEAIRLLRLAWQADHSLLTAGTSLARCLGLDLARHAEAHEVLDEVDAYFEPEASTRLIRGELLLEEGRHEEAAVIAESLFRAHPPIIAESATLLMSRIENERGLCAAKQAAHERSIFAFKRASDLDPMWAAPKSNLGASFEKLGRLRRAESAYREAIELDPRYAGAWHNLAKLYEKGGDPRALESFERAYLADTAEAEIAADYAIALARAHARERADAVLRAHAEEMGDSGDAWMKLAMPLAARGALELAELCVLRASERSSEGDLRAQVQVLLTRSQNQKPDLGTGDT